jgi:excisionase family DNA binding protein
MVTEKDFKKLLNLNKQLLEKVEKLEELILGNKTLVEPEKFLTKKQAEHYLNVSERQLTYMLSSGKLPFATKVGRQWRFPQSALEQYVARS